MMMLLALAAASVSAPAYTSDDAPIRVEVRYSDLDLRAKEGRSAFDARVRAAATRICTPTGDDGLIGRDISGCVMRIMQETWPARQSVVRQALASN